MFYLWGNIKSVRVSYERRRNRVHENLIYLIYSLISVICQEFVNKILSTETFELIEKRGEILDSDVGRACDHSGFPLTFRLIAPFGGIHIFAL